MSAPSLVAARRPCPPLPSKPAFPKPSPPGTVETSAYPILSGMSRPRWAALRLAASRFGRQSLGAGCAASTAGEGGRRRVALRCPKGVVRACAPEVPLLKCRSNFLYVRTDGSDRDQRSCQGDGNSRPYRGWFCLDQLHWPLPRGTVWRLETQRDRSRGIA